MSVSKKIYTLCLMILLVAFAYSCQLRSNMISRGQNWVDRFISYNRSETYDGYRKDCSGFVSMCWA